MNINRNNYETYFLLYTDNELSAADRQLVEQFVAENPDLLTELEQFQQYKLVPDEELVFSDKTMLYKPAGDQAIINSTNCESFFVLYADDELSNDEKAAVEQFIYEHPAFETELALFQKAKLSPESSIVFQNKEILYRNTEKRRVVPLVWFRWAAAAIVLLAIGLLWLNKQAPNNPIVLIKRDPEAGLQQKKEQVITNSTDTNHSSFSKEVIAGSEKQALAKRGFKALTENTKQQEGKSDQIVNKEKLNAVANNDSKEKTQDSIALIAVMPQKDLISNNALETGKLLAKSNKLDPNKIVLIDQPSITAHPDDIIENQISFAAVNDDRLELMNASVSKKNNLRGFLRKASRIIAKTTQKADQNGQHRSLLIGGFEIAGK